MASTPVSKGATLSADGRFRYRLWRKVALHNDYRVVWIMLNPSTADADTDDATIRKCLLFAKHWGYGGIEVANLYAYRTKDPEELKAAHYPNGDNDRALAGVFSTCGAGDLVIAAWGAHAQPNRAHEVRVDAMLAGVRLYHLGLNKNGSPKHPLYLPLSTGYTEWLL